jgi:hypothetical protein
LTAILLLVLIQWQTQAYHRDFDALGGDEPTHFVTCIMVRDYLVAGLGTSPLSFAERFYISYPRVAFGIWPPLFHLLGGVWFALAPPSRWAALLLMATLAGALAFLLYWEASRHFSRRWAVAAALVFLCLPLTIETSSFFGADPAVSLFMFAATLAWTRYLIHGQTKFAVTFGVLASVALLTKYNALSLALLPVISIPLSGQWGLFKRRATWLSAGIVVLLAGPWYLLSWKLVKYAAEGVAPDRWTALRGNVDAIGAAIGIALLIAAMASVARAMLQPGGPKAIWHISLFSLVVSAVLFHSIAYPYAQERYLLGCLPALLLLSTSGMVWILHSPHGGRLPAALAGASMLLFLGASHNRDWDRYSGLREVGEYVSTLAPSPGRRVLISSLAQGEGALVAEIAMREARPSSVLLRSSKMLARSTWGGEHYQAHYKTESQLLVALDELRVAYVVVDSFGRQPHDLLVQKTLPAAADWSLIKSFDRQQPGSGRARHFALYRRIGPFTRPERDLEVDLFYSLGRSLKANQLFRSSVAGSQTQIFFSK